MKNIFKTSKRSIAAILTLCILLDIAGACVYASSVMQEDNPTATEETIVAAEETTQELVPVMARACDNNVYYRANNWNVRDRDVNYYNGSIIDTTKGISVNTNPNNILINITAMFMITSIPSGLQLLSSGTGGHYEIVPAYNMHIDTYKQLIGRITYTQIYDW